MKEYSLFGIKPDVYTPEKERFEGDMLRKKLPKNPLNFIKEIKELLEEEGFDIILEKEGILKRESVEKHYEEFEGVWCDVFNENKFDFLLKYMTSGKSYWILFYGEDSVKKGREILINIRDKYLLNRKKARWNMTHASDAVESAKREISIHFPDFKFNKNN